MFFSDTWPEEKVEILKVMWTAGASAGQIARAIGKSRNAVLGKAHRFIKKGVLSTRVEATSKQPRAPRAPKAKAVNLPVPVILASPPVVLEDGSNVTTLTITGNMCRWPIGDPDQADFHYCGHPPNKTSYCEAHEKIAFIPNKPYVPRIRSKGQHI